MTGHYLAMIAASLRNISAFLQATSSSATRSGAACNARVVFDTDGQAYRSSGDGGTLTPMFVWKTSANPLADYEIKITPTGGSSPTFSTNAAASFVPMTSSIIATKNSGTLNVTQTVNFTVEIRATAGGAILATSTGSSLNATQTT
jgi:hypothetical protein